MPPDFGETHKQHSHVNGHLTRQAPSIHSDGYHARLKTNYCSPMTSYRDIKRVSFCNITKVLTQTMKHALGVHGPPSRCFGVRTLVHTAR